MALNTFTHYTVYTRDTANSFNVRVFQSQPSSFILCHVYFRGLLLNGFLYSLPIRPMTVRINWDEFIFSFHFNETCGDDIASFNLLILKSEFRDNNDAKLQANNELLDANFHPRSTTHRNRNGVVDWTCTILLADADPCSDYQVRSKSQLAHSTTDFSTPATDNQGCIPYVLQFALKE